MNVCMHHVTVEEALHNRVDIREGGGRNGTATLFFQSAEDVERMAEALTDLAEQMRQKEKVA